MSLTFPCGLERIDPDELSQEERLALVFYHGWINDEGVWLNPNYDGYEYGDPMDIIEDWTLWLNPDDIA